MRFVIRTVTDIRKSVLTMGLLPRLAIAGQHGIFTRTAVK